MPEINLNTQDPYAYLNLAKKTLHSALTEKTDIMTTLKRLNEVIASAEKAKALSPDLAESYYVLGYGMGLKGMIIRDGSMMQTGIDYYNRSISLKPVIAGQGYYPPLQYAIVKIRTNAKDERLTDYEALNLLKEAIRIYPEFAPAHYELAKAYRDQGKDELALQEAKTAVELSPDNGDMIKLVGLCYVFYIKDRNADLYQTAAEKGIEALKTAVRVNPNDYEVHEMLGFYYGVLGMTELKSFELNTALNLRPTYASYLEMGNTYLFSGEIEKALGAYAESETLGQATEPGGKNKTAVPYIGYCHYLNGNYANACEDFDKYLKIEKFPDIYRTLWHYYALLGDGKKALAEDMLSKYANMFHGTEWEKQLLSYHLNTISEDQLVNSARQKFDLCEAYYYIGCRYWHNGETSQAEQYFNKSMDTKIYFFYEYIASKVRLAGVKSHS